VPLYDYACDHCDTVREMSFRISEKPTGVLCPGCNGELRQVPAIGCIQGDEAEWIKSVTDIVDREGGRHCQEFIQSPTRSNWRNWMKGEGVRPIEEGEKPAKPKKVNRRALAEKVYQNHRKHKTIEVRT